ncbi:MAG: excinuclease ABC subunit UvrC [Candidatus Gracilibacteria bacterium]|nr:excinuclease ABC subunit UvrC [Candidatus Gracilibacteria bacterium]
MNKKIKDILERLPHVPGIYIMKDKKGKIIYVGKSVNLKNRVSSYFNSKTKLNFAKQIMVGVIDSLDYIETSNELEALVLETNYIKKNKPKYNILMKDDKNLTYIKITDDVLPEVYKTRIKNSHGDFFGPYTSTVNVTDILKVLRKIFKIRSCKIHFGVEENGKVKVLSRHGKNIPCLDYYLGLCPGPCLLDEDKVTAYRKNIENLKNFLKGNTARVLKDLEEEMLIKAKNLEFEEAGKLKEQIRSVRELSEKQIARDTIAGNNDILAHLEKYEKHFIGLTEIRDGEIVGIHNFQIENKLEEEKDELIGDFLKQYYADIGDRSPMETGLKIHLIINEQVIDKVLLDYLKIKGISIENPSIGPKIDIINFTKNNVLNFAYKQELGQISKKTLTRGTQASILEKLGYEIPIKGNIIFECYDISHLSGTHTVASRSIIINGKSDTSKYKKYKLKTIIPGEIDDFKSLREILSRRAIEVLKENNWPSLIIIDGGKGQLSSAIEAIETEIRSDPTIGFPNLCSIAKREEEIFIPQKSEPIIFEKGTPELMLLQKIRDEAHRFAISFNRSSRNKAMKKNILEELPGFGTKARQKLLKLAGSIDNIKNVDINEVEKIINKTQIETLKEYGII